jgi:saccharopine dehydrogenase-like NADP-dependent oxidoreductase
LIHYLLSHAARNKWRVIVADSDANAIAEKTNGHAFAEVAAIDVTNAAEREQLVAQSDIVVSLMPPHLHIKLAEDCLKYKKNLITSSYITPEMKAMDKEVKESGLMFMCEMGLDPGIDHMTANQIIHSIQRVAGSITSFKSYCGGLVAPENDDNPWHYKFSWNPRNVIFAGRDGAKYLNQGKHVDVPYEKMFDNSKRIKIDGIGSFAFYPNRDSLNYLEQYDVPEIKTFLRATLRHPSFCKGWNAIVALGLTSDEDEFEGGQNTYASWLKQKTGYHNGIPLKEYVAKILKLQPEDHVLPMIEWLGILDEKPLPYGRKSSALHLLDLLQEKWKMGPAEKDMVIMQHEVEYTHKERTIKLCSTMTLKGESRDYSAMSKTVGLPMGILARMVLTNKLNIPTGVHIPNMPNVYRPVLTELKHHGISFKEEVS